MDTGITTIASASCRISKTGLCGWLGAAAPGDSLVYYRGHLAIDRDPTSSRGLCPLVACPLRPKPGRASPAGVGDLYKVAIVSEPPIPLGDGNERSQKTRLGKALGQMRDRIFHVGPSALRITSAGIRHQARQWQLVHEGDVAPAGERGGPNAQPSPQRSPKETEDDQSGRERGERFFGASDSICGRCSSRAGGAEKRSPPSPRHGDYEHFAGKRQGEGSDQHPHDAGTIGEERR